MNQAYNLKTDTLKKILIAAHNEFSSKGLDAASVDSIAKQAGVSKQLIYHYYKTKEVLYKDILISVCDDMELLIKKIDYENLPAIDALKAIISTYISQYVKNPYYSTLTVDQSLHKFAHISEDNHLIKETKNFIKNIINPILKRGEINGELREGLDADIVYWLIYHICSGCFLNGEIMEMTTGIKFTESSGICLWEDKATEFIIFALRKP